MPYKLQLNRITIANQAIRSIWHIVWLILYRPSPRLFHAWRRLLLRSFGAKIGRHAHPYPSAKIWAPWNLEMGDYSCIGEDVDCYSVDKIIIGAHSTISQYSFICTASHDYLDILMPLITAPIRIGDYVWIASDVFIAPGVTINSGSVIAARSSVLHDIEPWMVVAGSPAKVIKLRKNLIDN